MSDLLFPIAISSQLDVTGEERIHAAKYSPLSRATFVPPPLEIVTWSPTDKNGTVTLSNGNLTATGTSFFQSVWATFARGSGKYQFEGTKGGGSFRAILGVQDASQAPPFALEPSVHTLGTTQMNNSFGYLDGDFQWCIGGLTGADNFHTTEVAGDVITYALDMDADTIAVYLNGVLQASHALPAGLSWMPATSLRFQAPAGGSYTLNVGVTPLVHPVSGYLAWNGATP